MHIIESRLGQLLHMGTEFKSAPPPDLRILPTGLIYPHEESDAQRAKPLIERIREAEYFTNPPIVAEVGDGTYVVLDGANRHYSFSQLEYEHLLVQVVSYDSPFVELGVWQHIVSDWTQDHLTTALEVLPDATIHQGWNHKAVAQVMLHDGMVMSVEAPSATVADRNLALREIVHTYHHQARLNRTAHTDPTIIWPQYPDAVALFIFPSYEPEDIIAAAKYKAYLPPGISRHIIHGRALKLFYPLDRLRDKSKSLEAKNAELQQWVRDKMAARAVRYYAESTYQFDE